MTNSYLSGQSLDDAMRFIIDEILLSGKRINPTKGDCIELRGVLIEITNPRARLSRTETRGKPFSCLGELCWYLAKTDKVKFISYYIPNYNEVAEGDLVFGGYGPRLFSYKNQNQVANVIDLLRRKPYSRRAAIQLFDANDLADDHKDIPCTCTFQFMIRDNLLDMITFMRSNDIYTGFPHDVFCFTMLQEIIARSLGVELGGYKHFVGSLHLYDKDTEVVKLFLNEGLQSTDLPMPAMPINDPWQSISHLLEIENNIRERGEINENQVDGFDEYWADLVRLLQIFRYSKYKDIGNMREINLQMSNRIYLPFIEKKINECQ